MYDPSYEYTLQINVYYSRKSGEGVITECIYVAALSMIYQGYSKVIEAINKPDNLTPLGDLFEISSLEIKWCGDLVTFWEAYDLCDDWKEMLLREWLPYV